MFVAGQFAGTIKAIEFLPVDNDTTRNLRVRMAVDEGAAERRFAADSKAKVRTLGLLGDKVIDISIGTPRYGVLTSGRHDQPSRQSLDYEAVLAQAAGAVERHGRAHARHAKAHRRHRRAAKATIGQLVTNRALYDEFIGTMARANTMLARFENPNGTLRAACSNDPTLYNRFVAVVTSADSLVIALNDKNGTIGKLLRDDTLYTSHRRTWRVAGDSLMKMLSNGHGLAGRLLNDPTLYDRLNKLTTDLSALLDDVRKDPHKYFKGVVCVIRCK